LTLVHLGIATAIVILCVPAVMSVLNYLRPQKRLVEMQAEYATKADVQVVDSKVEKLKSEIITNGEQRKAAIEAKVENARCESREDANEIKRDMAVLSREISELKGETQMITQSLARLELRPSYERTGK
jgi:septal ring factor EnvC (AmiA/AmiB activator)